VHAAYCGHPVAGDAKYGDAAANTLLRELGLRRMFLHAHSVSFDWPQGGQLSISAPLPAELKAVLDALTAPGQKPGARAGRSRRSAGSRRGG
jgi:23S rRNA pseudouridine955/2504/2580 synthase